MMTQRPSSALPVALTYVGQFALCTLFVHLQAFFASGKSVHELREVVLASVMGVCASDDWRNTVLYKKGASSWARASLFVYSVHVPVLTHI